MATFFNGKCGASPTSPLKAEEAGVVTLLRLHCIFLLQKFPSALRLHTSSAVSRICGAAGLLVPLSLAASAMAPKTEKVKAEKTKKEKSEQAARLTLLRKRNVVFSPRLSARELWNKYYLF